MKPEQAARIRELHLAAMKAQFAFDFGDVSDKTLRDAERDFDGYLNELESRA